MGLRDFKDFGKERELYPLRIKQTVVLLLYLIKFPSFLLSLPFTIRKHHRWTLRKKTMGNYMKYIKSKTEWRIWSSRRKRFQHACESKIGEKGMEMNKKQCTEGSCCLSTPLTKEQGTLQRRQTKTENISEIFWIVWIVRM